MFGVACVIMQSICQMNVFSIQSLLWDALYDILDFASAKY